MALTKIKCIPTVDRDTFVPLYPARDTLQHVHDQSMVELSGVRWSTEGEKNTASKTPPGFGDDYNKSPKHANMKN